MSVGFRDHQRCTDLQRPEELPHGHIESEGRLLQDHVVGSESVLGLTPLQVRDDGTVRDCNAFGASGRSGREDDIRSVVRAQRRQPVGVGDSCLGTTRQVEGVDVERGRTVRQHHGIGRTCEHSRGLRDLEYVSETVGRMIRVEWNVRAAGLDDRVHRDEEIDRSTHRETDEAVRSDTCRDEFTGQAVRSRVELRVGELRSGVIQRERIRRPLDLLVEESCEGHVCIGLRRDLDDRSAVGDETVDHRAETVGLAADQLWQHRGNDNRNQGIRPQCPTHRGVESDQLVIESSVADFGSTVAQSHTIRIYRRNCSHQLRQIFDRQRLRSRNTDGHLHFLQLTFVKCAPAEHSVLLGRRRSLGKY
ncbi:hypothetical protein B0E55_06328 [Rhodococcus sp. 66b]|nr:hypothetical protein B0E55_06328 [Rhodococcus sp. 66b]